MLDEHLGHVVAVTREQGHPLGVADHPHGVVTVPGEQPQEPWGILPGFIGQAEGLGPDFADGGNHIVAVPGGGRRDASGQGFSPFLCHLAAEFLHQELGRFPGGLADATGGGGGCDGQGQSQRQARHQQ